MSRSNPFRRLVTAVFLVGFLFGLLSANAFSWNPPDSTNVNSRYTVESVHIVGASEDRLSRSLREELQRYVGQRFSPDAFARLSARVREELKARLVSPKLMKGSEPEQVKVVLDVLGRRVDLHTENSRLAYHSGLGWTGDVSFAAFQGNKQSVRAGVFSDNDSSVERASGVKAGYRASLWNDRLRPQFSFSSSTALYDARTLSAAGPNDLYRSVDSFQPTVTLVPWRGDDRDELTVEIGLRYQRFVLQSPGPNRQVASHALVNTLRYRRVRGDIDDGQISLNAAYGLISGTSMLDTDYRFQRQEARGTLELGRQGSKVTLSLVAGALHGRAPLTDRFIAGNTQTLRGWNKFEIAPLGADRLLATSVEFGRAMKGRWELAAFADSGTLGMRGAAAPWRTSTGVGLRTRDGFYVLMAFPLREGRVEPMLMTGATF